MDINLQANSSYPKLAAKPVGQKIESIYTERLDQFTSTDQYQPYNLNSKLLDGVNDDEEHVKLSVYSPPNLERPTFTEATSHEFRPTHRGESFGPSWATHWFKIQLKIPTDMLNAEHLEFNWDANNEGMVWDKEGHPLQGLTGSGLRIEWVIPNSWKDGQEHVFYIEMACNTIMGDAPGDDIIQPPDPNKYFQLQVASITAVNLTARGLWVDFLIIRDAARKFPTDTWERHKALEISNKIMDTCINAGYTQESLVEARKVAQEYIGDVNSPKVYDTDKEPIVFGIGHCHIDTCWLWPWAETKRKIARSWLNQCDLLDRYPEHRFTASSAQQYKWLQQNYPFAFERVKDKVKKGVFQPIGGSWVEHDTNLPSGESLVRQFVYGQRFFEKNFGIRCKTFWLPDTFGYSGQLPQLCRLAGMNRFFTQKLSWNNINKYPNTTFNWVALDGTQVICHMPPSETYASEGDLEDVIKSVTQHKSLNQDKTSLLVFGMGDGGGGPTREYIEKLRRNRGVSNKTGLLPCVKMGDSVDDFYQRLEDKITKKGTQLVTWFGELYFELHRGTYTTHANNKYKNRKSEIMMHNLEYLATLASFKDKNYHYPKADIDTLWENILLCQFHDSLPGSAIEMCYKDSDALYAQNFELGAKVISDAAKALGLSMDLTPNQDIMALNTLPWQRSEIVPIPTASGSEQASQFVYVNGGPGAIQTQPMSAVHTHTVTIKEIKDGVFELANADFKVQVEKGIITSLYDLKAKREVISKGGKANQFVIFDDKPLYWQAWDAEVYHLDSRRELESHQSVISENGPYKVSLTTETPISSQSWIKSTISLSASVGERSYVEVDAEVEWHETMKFLKVEFPVDVYNTEASYESSYGIIRRPTNYNTTWDMAKFEVCCHNFADLSEHNYGVSILNDSKYGFATVGNLMRLSLIRAPKAPDAHADMGHHKIRWAIYPHLGSLDFETVRTAYNFNNPMGLFSTIDSKAFDQSIFSAVTFEQQKSSSIVLDVIKRAEDDPDLYSTSSPPPFPAISSTHTADQKSLIVRVYESLGGKSRGTIRTRWPLKKVFKTNVLEDDLEEVEFVKNGSYTDINVELRAFEVATFRIEVDH